VVSEPEKAKGCWSAGEFFKESCGWKMTTIRGNGAGPVSP